MVVGPLHFFLSAVFWLIFILVYILCHKLEYIHYNLIKLGQMVIFLQTELITEHMEVKRLLGIDLEIN